MPRNSYHLTRETVACSFPVVVNSLGTRISTQIKSVIHSHWSENLSVPLPHLHKNQKFAVWNARHGVTSKIVQIKMFHLPPFARKWVRSATKRNACISVSRRQFVELDRTTSQCRVKVEGSGVQHLITVTIEARHTKILFSVFHWK